MWRGGGFWGTEREEQWRRRKEKEYERESQIRHEEATQREKVIQRNQEVLQAKDNVLNLTRQMLSVSRSREEANESTYGTMEDQKMAASQNKRARVSDGEDSGASALLKNDDQNAIDAKRKIDPIEENLLCLSYAMFDTLFATDSFNPRSFCDFLLKSGSRSLAEEIGLAAIEKSNGKTGYVSYVLEHLVPGALVPSDLVARVKALLERQTMSDEGRAALLNWQMRHGDTQAAFQSALQIADETTRVKKCLALLEGKEERRRQLKEYSPKICADLVVSVFDDAEWPGFLSSIDLPKQFGWGQWCPALSVYLHYAANSMSQSAGRRAGTQVLTRWLRSQSKEIGYEHDRDGLVGSSSLHNEALARSHILKKREDATKEVKEILHSIHKALIADETMKGYLQKLHLAPMDILAQIIGKLTDIAPSQCNTSHRDLLVAYKCSRCREGFGRIAKIVGVLVGIKQHETTKNNAHFLKAVGFNGSPAIALQGYYSPAVSAILSGLDQETLQKNP